MSFVKNPSRLLVSHNPGHSFAFLLSLLLLIITYSNSFHASWHLDDESNITGNHRIHLKDLSWSSIKEASLSSPSTSSVSFFRPLSRLSLALNYYYGGEEVFGYHVVNLFIHILASWFLYLFIFNTLNLPRFKNEHGSHSFVIALLSMLFWAIHPIQIQAVTYIVQRMTSMAGLFYIMAMYFFVRSRTVSGRPARIILLSLCATCGLLSLGSKENAILLPVGLFLFHHLAVEEPAPSDWKRNLKLFSLLYLLPLIAGLAYLQIADNAIGRVFDIYESRTFTLAERLLTEPRVVLLYITLLFYPMPHRLSFDHDLIISNSLFSPKSTAFAILLISIMIVAACLQARKRPLLSFSVLFFFLNHALESTILPMEVVFEHRNYIPSMFFFFPLVLGIIKGTSTFPKGSFIRAFTTLSIVLVLVAFANSTYIRNSVWQDERSLWEDVLAKYPDSFGAHINLGRHFALHNQDERATHEFLRALASRQTHRRSEESVALYNLGYLAHRKGDCQAAFDLYSKALEIDPCCPRANNNLAVLLLETGSAKHSEALRLLNKALECNNGEEIENALGNRRALLLEMGEADETKYGLDSDSRTRSNGANLLRPACPKVE